MKKYLLHIVLIVLASAGFIFVHYSATNGLLFFGDSQGDDVASRFGASLSATAADASLSLRRLQELSADDVIVHTLAQFELGESLEKGALAVRRLANALAHCESLRLVSLDDHIVLDSARDSLEGKPLADDDARRIRSLLRKPGNFEILEDGRSLVVVRCQSRAGHDIGTLVAVFRPDLFARRLAAQGLPARVLAVSGGMVFVGLDGAALPASALAKHAGELRSSMRMLRSGDWLLIPQRVEFGSQVFVALASGSHAGLPPLASQILILLGLVIAALLLLLILRVISRWEGNKLDSIRERIDRHGDEMQSVQATAEEIIQATDTLYEPETASLPEYAEQAAPPAGVQDDEPPTLASILDGRKNAEPFDNDYASRNHDDELQSIIDKVTTGGQEPPALPEEDLLPLDAYWARIQPLFGPSLGIADSLLLEDDGAGVYRVRQRTGFTAACEQAFTISRGERLFELFMGRRKVLFIKEAALANRTLQQRLPGVAPDSIEQLAIVPVVSANEVPGLLVLGKGKDGKGLDLPTLQELQYLSIL